MAIEIYSEQIDFQLEHVDRITTWLEAAAAEEGYEVGDINIIFCDDEYLLNVNRQYLNHDYYTDIITFDYSEEEMVSGDLFISIDRVRENAEEFHQLFSEELHRIMVHGVMHLCGYQDKEPLEKTEMTGKEDFYLKKLSTT